MLETQYCKIACCLAIPLQPVWLSLNSLSGYPFTGWAVSYMMAQLHGRTTVPLERQLHHSVKKNGTKWQRWCMCTMYVCVCVRENAGQMETKWHQN